MILNSIDNEKKVVLWKEFSILSLVVFPKARYPLNIKLKIIIRLKIGKIINERAFTLFPL